MTYAEKLKDPRWQKKRLEILERDNWKCMLCGDKDSTLHVHHLFYYNGQEPWDYDNEALITLCEDCHEEAKNNQRETEKSFLIDLYYMGVMPWNLLNFLLYLEYNGVFKAMLKGVKSFEIKPIDSNMPNFLEGSTWTCGLIAKRVKKDLAHIILKDKKSK